MLFTDVVSPDVLCCSVNVPPLILVNPPKDAQFREYESIELPCEAVGIPTPKSVLFVDVNRHFVCSCLLDCLMCLLLVLFLETFSVVS